MEPLYIEFENHLGEKRYQPRLDTGERARIVGKMGGGTTRSWTRGTTGKAVLCRTKREAERMAKREMRLRDRALRGNFKEVSSE